MKNNKLSHPFLWLCVIFVISFIWGGDNFNIKKYLPQLNQNLNQTYMLEQSKKNADIINYSKFILASLEHNHKAIEKYGAKIKLAQVMPKVINELVNNMNFDLALEKAKQYPNSQMAKIVLGFNAFKLKQYKSAIKHLQNNEATIAKIAIILSKKALGEKFTIPNELKFLSYELNNKNPQKFMSTIMRHSKKEFFLKLAFFIDQDNFDIITDISSLLLEKKTIWLSRRFCKKYASNKTSKNSSY